MDVIDLIDLSPVREHESKEKQFLSFLTIQRLCMQEKPFFIGRLSGNEPYFCGLVYKQQEVPQYLIHNMLTGAGIHFASNEDAIEYVRTYLKSFKNCDLVGVYNDGGGMYNQSIEFYKIIRALFSKFTPICANGLFVFNHINSSEYQFYKVFENKKVLVISSHCETIKSQLPKFDKLFKIPVFHSSTQFYVHKPPQQNAGSHDLQSWQFHFEKLKNEIKYIQSTEFDFDIALVSCGGFGMPISAYINENLNKSVIYFGATLQLCFGVTGQRWLSVPQDEVNMHLNEHWVRPLEVDKPKNINLCEGGCYW